jgi:hypothetical protein
VILRQIIELQVPCLVVQQAVMDQDDGLTFSRDLVVELSTVHLDESFRVDRFAIH